MSMSLEICTVIHINVVSEMTYTVLSGTLNSSIPYHINKIICVIKTSCCRAENFVHHYIATMSNLQTANCKCGLSFVNLQHVIN